MPKVTLNKVKVIVQHKHLTIYGEDTKLEPRHPWDGDLIMNCTVQFFENGSIHIEGEELDYKMNHPLLGYVDINDVDESDIKTKKTWFTRKDKRYLEKGWVLMKKRVPFKKVFINYTVRIE